MRHLLSTADLSRDDALGILDDADGFAQALLGRDPQTADPSRADRDDGVLRELDPHSASFEVAGSG